MNSDPLPYYLNLMNIDYGVIPVYILGLFYITVFLLSTEFLYSTAIIVGFLFKFASYVLTIVKDTEYSKKGNEETNYDFADVS